MKKFLYGILMVACFSLGYLFINRGVFLKSYYRVRYNYNNDVDYDVIYNDYDGSFNDNDLYISKMIKEINVKYNLDYLYDVDFSGYYDYDVSTKIVAYVDDIDNVLWEKEESLVDSKIIVIDKNNFNNIKIEDSFKIDFNKYKDVIDKFNLDAEMECQGYLVVNINFNNNINFYDADGTYLNNYVIKMIIPLTKDSFKISIIGNDNDNDYVKVYKNRDKVNYILLVCGLFFISMGISFGILIIKIMIDMKKYEDKYNIEIKKIFNNYREYLVKVKNFYNNKKYNIIDVDNINELVKLCDKNKLVINYKEIKKNSLCLFVVVDRDNVYVYRLKSLRVI